MLFIEGTCSICNTKKLVSEHSGVLVCKDCFELYTAPKPDKEMHLLGEIPIPPIDTAKLNKSTILITGGAGSLGRALINEIQKISGIKTYIRVLDNNEHALATLNSPYPYFVRKLHGSITDRDRVARAVAGVDIVIHCAAMKNLEITEYNTSELIKNNVVGTDIVISSAVDAGVKKILFISSDKAVQPVSIYGASKLIGEHTALNYNLTSNSSKVSVFRSGNFYDSNGNVFELWKKRTELGLPIQITDIKCSRYFIHTETAAKTIINCIHEMKGGEIFVPNDVIMTEIPIVNLALKFTKDNKKELEVEYTGLRRGEKISELLFNQDELMRRLIDLELNCWIIT